MTYGLLVMMAVSMLTTNRNIDKIACSNSGLSELVSTLKKGKSDTSIDWLRGLKIENMEEI